MTTTCESAELAPRAGMAPVWHSHGEPAKGGR